jgi:hypothetical protein
MRIGWRIPLPGPLSLSGTLWRSKRRRRRAHHGTLTDPATGAVLWTCPHNHERLDTATACAARYQRALARRTAA